MAEDRLRPTERIASAEDMRQHGQNLTDLRRVLDELRDHWAPLTEKSPEELVRAWIAIVAIVEVGYDGLEEEYWHDLMTREFIDVLCKKLPGHWAARFAEWIGPWDERFRAATVEETRPHLHRPDDEAGWWWYRSPRLWPGRSS
jgi:hypothetical protein